MISLSLRSPSTQYQNVKTEHDATTQCILAKGSEIEEFGCWIHELTLRRNENASFKYNKGPSAEKQKIRGVLEGNTRG
jgi:hypothetical protein